MAWNLGAADGILYAIIGVPLGSPSKMGIGESGLDFLTTAALIENR
ncbi:MAG: hypothetical protein QG616_1496 [Pseudomonadota bacterium]|nr:hypothetical protein [Pseudomonadota bacterium]